MKKQKRGKKVTHRVTTHRPNGAESVEVAPEKLPVGEAMRKAVEELGDVQIDAELAPAQLRELAESYQEVVRRRTAFNEKAEDAKVAKKGLEAAQSVLEEKVRLFCYPAPLPLFDAKDAEADREEMLAPRPDLEFDVDTEGRPI